MATTKLHELVAPLKRLLPSWAFAPVRRIGTVLLTPVYFSMRSAHARSSIKAASVSADGRPMPWYTFPCIEFIERRDFSGRNVLEFGGGQSSIWWSERASQVLTFEGDRAWHDRIRSTMPRNVDLRLVQGRTAADRIREIRSAIDGQPSRRFDVIVIDGLDRRELVAVAVERLAEGGVIICDNAEGYGFHEALQGHGLSRVDFIGHAPGVILPHCTSIAFRGTSFVFENDPYPISVERGLRGTAPTGPIRKA